MSADFVARLGSRASVPSEVRSRWDVPDYVDLMAPRAGLEQQLRRAAYRQARALRRVDPERVLAVLAALAAQPSAELNKERIARAAGVPATTITAYLDVLLGLGLIRTLPGTRSPVAKRAIARPCVLFDDVALARHLAGPGVEELTELGGRRRLAPLLKGLVGVELLRQQVDSAVDYRLSHLRERNGLRVDLLIELADNTLYGVEVRTASSFRSHQFRSLEALAVRAGSRFRGGVVLNTATVGYHHRPGMWGLPISALWDWDHGADALDVPRQDRPTPSLRP